MSLSRERAEHRRRSGVADMAIKPSRQPQLPLVKYFLSRGSSMRWRKCAAKTQEGSYILSMSLSRKSGLAGEDYGGSCRYSGWRERNDSACSESAALTLGIGNRAGSGPWLGTASRRVRQTVPRIISRRLLACGISGNELNYNYHNRARLSLSRSIHSPGSAYYYESICVLKPQFRGCQKTSTPSSVAKSNPGFRPRSRSKSQTLFAP